jgi:hypothetical protein
MIVAHPHNNRHPDPLADTYENRITHPYPHLDGITQPYAH